jgi:hypothetical protein
MGAEEILSTYLDTLPVDEGFNRINFPLVAEAVSREPLVPNPLTYGPRLHIPDCGEFFRADCSVKAFKSFCDGLHNRLILGRESAEVFELKLLFIFGNKAVR